MSSKHGLAFSLFFVQLLNENTVDKRPGMEHFIKNSYFDAPFGKDIFLKHGYEHYGWRCQWML